jgi:hypothetical protein
VGAEGIGSANTVRAAAGRHPHANENRQFLCADCYLAGNELNMENDVFKING